MVHRINVFLLSLFIVIAQSFSNLAFANTDQQEQLKKWNSARTQELRNKVAQDGLYGKDSGKIVVRDYDRTKKMVEASVTKYAVEKGSQSSITAKVKVPASATKSASVLFKRLGKGGIQGMVAGWALQTLINKLDWVMGDGGKVIYHKETCVQGGACFPNDPIVYVIDSRQDPSKYGYSDPQAACDASKPKYENNGVYSVTHATYIPRPDITAHHCTGPAFRPSGESLGNATWQIYAKPNPDLNKPLPEKTRVTEKELADQIENEMTEGSKIAADILVGSYSLVDEDGNVTEDISKADRSLSADSKEIEDTYREVILSDDPVSTGKTDSIPVFKDGRETTSESTSDSSSKNYDKDGNETGSSQTTEKTTTTFQFPAFCDWASIVCEWIDWTKEEPSLDDENLQIDDVEVQAYERSEYVKFGATCPFSPSTASLPMGILGSMNFEIDLTFICRFGEDARPFVQGLGYLGGLIYLMVGLRNGNG